MAGPLAARPLDTVTASGTLRVALYADDRPFSESRAAGPWGIEVDIARAVATILGVAAEIRIVEAAESVDGDFRLNLWKGDLAGTPLADLMLHVPHDRMLALQNEQIVLTNAYFEERLALCVRGRPAPHALGDVDGLTIAVAGTSTADLALLLAEGGRLRAQLRHFGSFDSAADSFRGGQVDALAGTLSAIEAAAPSFCGRAVADAVLELPNVQAVRAKLKLGGAVRGDSRDLGYAVSEALDALRRDGRLRVIFERHGVSYTPPDE